MTLQLLHSIFPYMYMRKIWFSFLSVHLIICPHPDFLNAEYLPYLLLDIYLLSATSCLISLYWLLLPAWYLPTNICYFLLHNYLLSTGYLPILCLYHFTCLHAHISAREYLLAFCRLWSAFFWHVAVFRRKTRHGDCNRGTAGFAYVGGACVVNKRLEKVILTLSPMLHNIKS